MFHKGITGTYELLFSKTGSTPFISVLFLPLPPQPLSDVKTLRVVDWENFTESVHLRRKYLTAFTLLITMKIWLTQVRFL
jgi:hypothetical protein